MGAVACVVSERIHWDWKFSDEKFKKFVDLQTKRQIFMLIIHYYQLNLHQIGFLFDNSQKKSYFEEF
jgi:hypothetical protein